MPVSRKRRKRANKPANARDSSQKSAGRSLYVTGIIAAALIGGVTYWLTGRGDGTEVSVTVPTLTGAAIKGERLFNANCGSCHGKNAAGSDKGPPLVHKIYEPGHHGGRTRREGAPLAIWRYAAGPRHVNAGYPGDRNLRSCIAD